MIIRKRKHISMDKKEKITVHFVSEGFTQNKDFHFEESTEKDQTILVLHNTDNIGSIFDSYSKIEETMFLIRMAKDKWQTSFDIVTTFWGTIETCKQYLKDNFELDSYKIKHCTYNCTNSINLNDLK